MVTMFPDKQSDLEKRIDRLIEHFRHGEYLFFSKNQKGLPTPTAILWLLLQDAMRTVQNMPDDELRMVSKVRSSLPSSRTTIDQAFSTELSRLTDGMAQYDDKRIRHTVHQADADRMVDILDLCRFVVGGRNGANALRMKRVVLARAGGLTLEQCGRIWDRYRTDFDRRAFHDLKQRVLGQILAGIEREFGLKGTNRSFRRYEIREIERRTKDRKRAEGDACVS